MGLVQRISQETLLHLAPSSTTRRAAQGGRRGAPLLRYRRELEWPAEDILRERRASNPSAVRKLVAFGGEEAARYLAILDGIEPHLEIAHPPGVASLVLRRDAFNEFHTGASIAGADRNIIAMYAGPYRPTLPPPGTSRGLGFSSGCLCNRDKRSRLWGFYLVCDSLANSLAAVPPLPPSSASQFTNHGVGSGAGVLRHHDPPSEYVLAELLYHRNSCTMATLFTWQVDQQGGCTPLPSDPADIFRADIVFALGDSSICRVDLLKGILICDKVMDGLPKFRFISLPEGCSQGTSAPCAVFAATLSAGDIDDLITLRTWTLCISNSEWTKGGSFRIVDVWADPTYEGRKLPKKVPRS
ncbi:hypothetical protein SETIT_6G245500v2 [Setaria italica]|uniref:DUF1618 domain-containing protein n=1 Tax=Setaria italica TaxID=4555 RepID=K3YN25_SETIT|nr:hypothetical protein SETIT_6G245500v2 [Setaria italica]